MTLKVVDYHSVRMDLLTGAPILDVGARGFDFARHFAARGHKVIAMDPDRTIDDPKIENVHFLRSALVGDEAGARRLVMTDDPQARFIAPTNGFPAGATQSYIKASQVDVNALTIQSVMTLFDVKVFDVVKMNCEGEEYEILSRWPGPVARQVVVSFHEHYRPRGRAFIAGLVDHLAKWYRVVQHPWDERYSGGFNHWDSLFALKELVS